MQTNDKADEIKTDNAGRGKPCSQRPWCWQEKATLRRIRDVFGSTATSAVAVYVALTEIASDAQSESFTRSIGEIAARARVSYRTASAILNGFEALKLLDVKRNTIEGTKLQAPNTYTLGNYCLPLGNGRQRPSLPRKNKSPEKSEKNDDEKRVRETAAPSSTPLDSSSSISILNLEDAKKHPYWRQFKAYCERKGGLPTLKGFKTWLQKQPPIKPKSQPNGAPKTSPRYQAALKASQAQFDAEHGIAAVENIGK